MVRSSCARQIAQTLCSERALNRINSRHRRRGSYALVRLLQTTAVVISMTLAFPAPAATVNWNCTGSGAWSNAGCWSSGSPPNVSDSVILENSTTTNTIVGYDYSSPWLSSLTLDTSDTGSITLNLGLGSPVPSLSAFVENIGLTGSGSFVQQGGNNTVRTELNLGYESGSQGAYALSGGHLGIKSGSVGRSGDGVFYHSAGVHDVSSELTLGSDTGGSGSYDLSGGNLSAGSETIGGLGTGRFSQAGGTHSVSGKLTLGASGSGTYDLSAGALSTDNAYIAGAGEFIHTGGIHTVSDALVLGGGLPGVTGSSYALSGTGELNAWVVGIGDTARGSFDQSGGKLAVGANLGLGGLSGSRGIFEFTGGEINAERESIGVLGGGTFTQSGGTNSVNDLMVLGQFDTGAGFYQLANGLLGTGNVTLGLLGQGEILQTGGVHRVSGDISLGVHAGSRGRYTMENGILEVGGSINSGLGDSTLRVDNGSLIMTTGIDIDVGNLSLAIDFGIANTEQISAATELLWGGHFNQSGGSHTVENTLRIVGDGSVYALSGGQLDVRGEEIIGHGYVTSFEQSGGIHDVGHHLLLAMSYGSEGHYRLSDGDLHAQDEIIGVGGDGFFSQTGGRHSVMNELSLGMENGGNGHYELIRGSLSTGITNVGGNYGDGTFIQSGGTHEAIELNINSGSGTPGGTRYDLSGGALSVDDEHIGNGRFTQSDGEHSANRMFIDYQGAYALQGGKLTVGSQLDIDGDFQQSGGTLAAGSEAIGQFSGGGIFTQTDGSHAVANTLTIATTPGSSVTYNLQGGRLAAGSIVNNGTFNYSAGSLKGDFTNNGTLNLGGAGTRIFNGDISNHGTLRVNNTTAVYNGLFINGGAYHSDPSNNYFSNLTITDLGYLTGGAGDNFFISGDLINNSLANDLWDTDLASLILNGNGNQNVYFAGIDLGAVFAGYNDNFAWGRLAIGPDLSLLNLSDGNNTAGAALYAREVLLAGNDLSLLSLVAGDFNIYYDPRLAANTYLGGLDYTFGSGSGMLIAIDSRVPEPHTWLLLMIGLLGLAVQRRIPDTA